MQYKWLVTTEHGKQGKRFHLAYLKLPYIMRDDGLELWNRNTMDFVRYYEGIDYGTMETYIDKDPLQFKFEFDLGELTSGEQGYTAQCQ